MEGGLSGRPTKCRYCQYPATKWRCHGNHFWLSIYAVYIGATWRIRLNRPCAAAMRPYVKLLWPLVQLLWQCDDAWTKVSNELPATIQLIWCNLYSAILKLTAQTTNNYLKVSTLEYIIGNISSKIKSREFQEIHQYTTSERLNRQDCYSTNYCCVWQHMKNMAKVPAISLDL